jgi:hypothetical protein
MIFIGSMQRHFDPGSGFDPGGAIAGSAGSAAAVQALLLQMVGGVGREFPGTGMKLRGDIHICLMGDPGDST